MAFSVIQKGASAGGQTTVPFGATTPGSCLIILAVSNNAAAACTAGGQTLMGAAYGTGHNGDYCGIWFLPNNPGGISNATVSGSYAVGFLEVSGVAGFPNLLDATYTGGDATQTSTFSCANPAASAADFTVTAYAYDVTNSGTPFADHMTGTTLLSNYGQFSYTTGTGMSYGVLPAGTYDCCAVSFAPASAGGLTPNPQPAAGVYRGPCGGKLQDSNTSTVAQAGILAYEAVAGPARHLCPRLPDGSPHVVGAVHRRATRPDLRRVFAAVPVGGPAVPVDDVPVPVRVLRPVHRLRCHHLGAGGRRGQRRVLDGAGQQPGVLGVRHRGSSASGREWNGNWYNWSPSITGDTAAHYIAGYQHLVTLLRGIPGIQLDVHVEPDPRRCQRRPAPPKPPTGIPATPTSTASASTTTTGVITPPRRPPPTRPAQRPSRSTTSRRGRWVMTG